MQIKRLGSQTVRLAILIVFQSICTLFFVIDVAADLETFGRVGLSNLHALPELGATAGLMLGIGFEVRVLMTLLRRQAQLEKGMSVAAGSLAQVIAGYYTNWGLTASEQDVAGFTIKGYSIAEIATLRGSAPGTIKTHLNAIYRKAKVAGRAQLVSLLVEDLLRAPLLDARPGMALKTV